MLPNLRVILVTMTATAITVTLVGTALKPVPRDVRSAALPRAAEPPSWQTRTDNRDRQQFHMLGYARRAVPIETANGSTSEGGTSTYVKQGGDTAEHATLAGDRPMTHPNDPDSDSGMATGTVNTNTSEPPANATNDGLDLAAPTRIARTQTGVSATDAIQSGRPIALSAALPPLPRPRPFLLFRRPIPAVRSAVGAPSLMRDLAADLAVGASERALANRAPASTGH
jgi:hypothetical protein